MDAHGDLDSLAGDTIASEAEVRQLEHLALDLRDLIADVANIDQKLATAEIEDPHAEKTAKMRDDYHTAIIRLNSKIRSVLGLQTLLKPGITTRSSYGRFR